MERLVKQDPYLSFVFKDLRRRNPHIPPSELLLAIFNANVVGDSIMMDRYMKV